MDLPVTVDQLKDMWAKDAVVDSLEPGRELLKIPSLHSKYLSILMHHNLLLKKLKGDFAKKRKLKYEYYNGYLNDPEELKKMGDGTKPQLQKLLKQDIGPIYLDSDDELVDLQNRMAVQEEITAFASAVIKELGSRTWQLRSYIEWARFTGGN